MIEEEEYNYNDDSKTLPDYVNVRNSILNSQIALTELTSVLLTTHSKAEYKSYLKSFKKTYYKLFTYCNDEKKLAKLKKDEIKYLKSKFSNLNLIKYKDISIINDLMRKLVGKIGVYEIEKDEVMYI